jgi:hypothetical protein
MNPLITSATSAFADRSAMTRATQQLVILTQSPVARGSSPH